MCWKHVVAWNKLIVKQKFCVSSWLITEIKKNFPTCFGLRPSSVSLHQSLAKFIFRLRFGKNRVVICYALVWQRVMGMVCVLFAVLSVKYGVCTVRCGECEVWCVYCSLWWVWSMLCVLFAVLSATHTQHSEQYTHHTYDMLPHHRITYNDVVFTES